MKSIWMVLATMMLSSLAHADGALQVSGQAGKFQIFQKVKAVRCSMVKRGSCDAPIFFDLNKTQNVPAGNYIVGFENSIYPELVTVSEGRTANLALERVNVPSQVRGQRIRVYRDFGAAVEQKKIHLTMFLMNRHFFRLEKENFGDLYLTGSWDRDFVQRFTYETCDRISSYNAAAEAKAACATWNSAKIPSDLSSLYLFKNDGTFFENWVTPPGDVIPSEHPKYLVATPMSDSDFVAVFPGAYKFQAEGKGMPAVSVKVGNIN